VAAADTSPPPPVSVELCLLVRSALRLIMLDRPGLAPTHGVSVLDLCAHLNEPQVTSAWLARAVREPEEWAAAAAAASAASVDGRLLHRSYLAGPDIARAVAALEQDGQVRRVATKGHYRLADD
jgi:hypothetical protein